MRNYFYSRLLLKGSLLACLIIVFSGCTKSDNKSTMAKNPPQNVEQNTKNAAETDIVTDEEQDIDNGTYDFTICFAGDINFDDEWCTVKYMDSCPGGIYDCISEELIEHMNEADIMWINNEFPYTDSEDKLQGKLYNFKANPNRVELLEKLGVDIVGLANNHAYDFGEQGLIDTFDTLNGAGILYVGAGKNIEEAKSPVYMEKDGKVIAFVGASRAEKNIKTPQATQNSAGILRCYDTELFLSEIKEARENADFVVALVHWGTEYSHELEEVQLLTGKEYIDAGADIIVGAHSHCLQGMEYYNGKAIAYSLGNYWFNDKDLDTMLLEVRFHGDDNEENIGLKVIPAVQTNMTTIIAQSYEEKRRIFDFIEDISINVEIDDDGHVSEILDNE